MPTVGLKLGQESPGTLADALASAGFEVVKDGPEVTLITASEMDREEVERWVDHVIDGGALLVCGGTGPLLAALHLTPQGEPVGGAARPCYAGLEPLPELERASPVTGVGFALYRIDDRCVALGGRRDGGVLAYVGDTDPAPPLALAVLRWMLDLRSDSASTE